LNNPRRIAAVFTATITLFFGCSRSAEIPIEIPFTPVLSGQNVSCQVAPSGFSLHDLRFYVHDVALIDAAGVISPVTLTPDNVWQTEQVALLDFENGSDGCSEGTVGTHGAIVGRVKQGDYTGLRFTLGIPFDLNHANPAEAVAPLNLGRLHWGWQAGYKFLRLEASASDGDFRFHLGSTGCEGTIGHITSCARPNRAVVEVENFAPGKSIDIDLTTLVQTPAAHPKENDAVSCMSDIDSGSCREPFRLIGLDLATGAALPQQLLFKVRS